MQLLYVRSTASRSKLVGLIRPLLEECPVPAGETQLPLVLCFVRGSRGTWRRCGSGPGSAEPKVEAAPWEKEPGTAATHRGAGKASPGSSPLAPGLSAPRPAGTPARAAPGPGAARGAPRGLQTPPAAGGRGSARPASPAARKASGAAKPRAAPWAPGRRSCLPAAQGSGRGPAPRRPPPGSGHWPGRAVPSRPARTFAA